MTRTTPELAPPLQTSASNQRENIWSPKYDLTCNKPYVPHTRLIFRMHRRRLATSPSFDVRAIYHHNAGNRCTYKPTSHIDFSCSDDGE
ncbi:hypothetical protein AVEN_4024-1 [Araneus ventricosus]|uniref:Uncharacterized protein n=1 Tax=Araneus ventricosus TaxID=182803 RepID=A0A4Y2J438_ARAVE|nr:hypothetical protein AVEN_4024-1 [Araneus ventricosus]